MNIIFCGFKTSLGPWEISVYKITCHTNVRTLVGMLRTHVKTRHSNQGGGWGNRFSHTLREVIFPSVSVTGKVTYAVFSDRSVSINICIVIALPESCSSWPLPLLLLTLADEFATLCGSQRPGFVIDIYTGLPVGEFECVCLWVWWGCSASATVLKAGPRGSIHTIIFLGSLFPFLF